MGLVAMLIGYAARKQAKAAGTWPLVTARINSSKVDSFEGRLDDDDNRTRTLYRPLISYGYEFGGVKYQGSQVSLGLKLTSSSDGFAKKQVAKYPVGAILQVHVNPKNPAESALSAKTSGAWFIWIVSLILFGVAYFVSQQP